MALLKLRSLASISLLGPKLNNIQKPVALTRCFSDNAAIKSRDGPTAVDGANNTELHWRASYMAGVFGGSEQEMEKYLKSNSHIGDIKWEKFYDCIQILKANGMKKEDIFACPAVFVVGIPKLESRIKMLREKGLDIGLPSVYKSSARFQRQLERHISKLETERELGDHVTMFKRLLGCSEEQAQNGLEKCKWIKNSSLPTLKKNIETLQRYDVSGEAILKHMSVVILRQEELEKRLSSLKQHGVCFPDYPKAVMSFLKKPATSFKLSFAKLLADRAILEELGCRDKKEYLMKRLRCGERDLNLMKDQVRDILNANLQSLKENLDFLLDTCKFPPEDIIMNAICLSYSNAKLRHRFEILRENDIDVVPHLLKMAETNFNKAVAAIVCKQL